MAMLEPLSLAAAREVAEKFALSRGEVRRITTNKNIKPAFIHQLCADNIRSSRIYRLLEPLSYEVIVMLKAKYRNKNLLRHIEDFFSIYNGMRICICGDDLKRLGIKPGPHYQQILRRILDARLDGRVKTKEEELALARRLARPS